MQVIITEKDLKYLQGKFVIQLQKNKSDEDITISDNPGFWLEKRIRFISFIGFGGKEYDDVRDKYISTNGLYYTNSPKSEKEFIKEWNQEGKERFYRILTTKELKWLFEQLIKNDY